ncbi:MAG: serine/threonine dehydratase [Acidimicrobiia bacterium]
MSVGVGRDRIEAAASRIKGHVRTTPILDLGDVFNSGWSLSLKLDNLQPTGSFKVRGAFSLLTTLEPGTEVVAASGGNFALAVARAGSGLELAVTVFVPETSPAAKIARIREEGAEVRVVAGYYDHALEASREWASRTGAFEAHAYDDPEVVAGQGTLGLEVSGQRPGVDTVVVAVGGGGLIAGIASWFRGDVSVVGVESRGCRSFHAALTAGHPVDVEVSGVAASSLGARSIGHHAWQAREWIADSVLVEDADITAAQRWLWEEARIVAEPAAAVTVAALRMDAFAPAWGENVVAVISGGNVDPGSVA